MVNTSHEQDRARSRVKTYRWYFYFALAQFSLYFIVPMLIFPNRVIKDIEVISALTLGLMVGLFFLLTCVLGLFLDRERRSLYLISASVVVVYFAGALVSWSYIESLDFLLR